MGAERIIPMGGFEFVENGPDTCFTVDSLYCNCQPIVRYDRARGVIYVPFTVFRRVNMTERSYTLNVRSPLLGRELSYRDVRIKILID